MLRFLVLDAYPREDREALLAIGGKLGGERYVEVLRHLEPDCDTDLAYPADSDDPLPPGASLTDYDGIVWSGSTLTVHESHDERVRRTIDLAQAGFAAGVPSYGSCYAAQVAVVAAGGSCIRNPRGRELGAVHDIELTEVGRRHAFFAARAAGARPFSVFQSHQDIVDALPEHAEVLARNDHSPVQAVAVRHGAGVFWAVQYHPEWSYDEVADVFQLRDEGLVEEGCFGSLNEAQETLRDFRSLARHGAAGSSSSHAAAELLDVDQRVAEARSWIDACVKPRRAGAHSEAV